MLHANRRSSTLAPRLQMVCRVGGLADARSQTVHYDPSYSCAVCPGSIQHRDTTRLQDEWFSNADKVKERVGIRETPAPRQDDAEVR